MDLTTTITQTIQSYDILHERYRSPRPIREHEEGHLSLLFEAEDIQTSQLVVLKFLHPRLTDPYWEAAFAREEALLFELRGQPHIIGIVDGRRHLNVFLLKRNGEKVNLLLIYHVLERADSTLEHYLASEQKQPYECLCLFRELCMAVAQLHQQQICHRDIKPGNCVLFHDRTPILHLIDFAFAYRTGEPRLATGTQFDRRYAIPITDRHYTALEFYCGFGRDARFFFGGDFFSLGAVLFEMWTGRNLIDLVYDVNLAHDIAQLFYKFVNDNKREESYRKLLVPLKRKWVLPDLNEFVNGPWKTGIEPLNKLYRSLADLDYRDRCTNFVWIFKQINAAMEQLPGHGPDD